MSIQKYIILDRDGVINKDSAEHIKSPDEWMPIPRSLEAIRLLTENNFHITVISNQSGINRGIISYKNFIGISNKMHQEIIDNGVPCSHGREYIFKVNLRFICQSDN